jgi:hypothetical protein
MSIAEARVTHTCQHELDSVGFKRRRNRALSFLGVLEVVGWTCAATGSASLWLWPDALNSIVAQPTLAREHSARGNATKKRELVEVAPRLPGGLGHPATAGVPDRSSTPAVDVLETASHSPAPAVAFPQPTEKRLTLIDDDAKSAEQAKPDSNVEAVSDEIQEASASTDPADLDIWLVHHLASLGEEAPRDFSFVWENTVEGAQESASKTEDKLDLPINSAANPDAIQVNSQSTDSGTSHTSAPPSHAILAQSEIDSLVARGEQLLVRGDLASARLFFRRAADAGDIRGAAGMARSFDQETLRSLPVFGARPDPGQAAIWHTRANELGRVVAGR